MSLPAELVYIRALVTESGTKIDYCGMIMELVSGGQMLLCILLIPTSNLI